MPISSIFAYFETIFAYFETISADFDTIVSYRSSTLSRFDPFAA